MINTGSYNGYPGLLNADLFDRTETENIVPLSNNIIKTENIVPLSNGIIVDIFDLDIFGLRKMKKRLF